MAREKYENFVTWTGEYKKEKIVIFQIFRLADNRETKKHRKLRSNAKGQRKASIRSRWRIKGSSGIHTRPDGVNDIECKLCHGTIVLILIASAKR
jgi:hypothetical protein